ncbi:MAG: T9SS type A sorting domain-containing protein [Chitinophagales bacterium]
MKNRITLLTLALLYSAFAQAQTNYEFDPGDNYGNGTKNMIGQREYRWDNNVLQWTNIDSFDLHYNSQNQMVVRNELKYDTAGSTWKNYQHTTVAYNANGLVDTQVDTASNPTTGHRYEYIYSATNRELQKLDKRWNSVSNIWDNYRRYSNTYTAIDSVNVYLEEGWNPVNNIWLNGTRYIHVYNPQNLDSNLLIEYWNTPGSLWIPFYKYSYTYDASGNQTYQLYQEYDTSFAVYKNKRKYENVFNAANRMTSQTQSIWNSNINIWQYEWRYTYTYDAQNVLQTQQLEKWNTNTLQWDLWTYYIYTYNGSNQPVTAIYQNRVNGAWENASKETFTRGADGYRTNYLVEFWNTNTLAWQNFTKIDYWYTNKAANAIDEQPLDRLFAYPNPVNSPVLFVNAEKNLTYAIYDITGRVIQQGTLQPGTNSLLFDVPQGMYLLNAGNATTRIIKQ